MLSSSYGKSIPQKIFQFLIRCSPIHIFFHRKKKINLNLIMAEKDSNIDIEQHEKLLKHRNASISSRKSGMLIKLEKQKKQIVQRCVSQVVRRIYILNWITTYNGNFFISDLIAGITLGLTMIPQAIAYAALAGLSSQYGLYAAFIGSYIYVIFGSVKQVSIGPTSLMALLVLPLTAGKPIEYVFVLAFIAGCIELLLGIFRLGMETSGFL